MANIADATVRIQAQGCAKEVKAWLEAVDDNAYYNICDDHAGTPREDLGENSADFCGVANGRWTYQSNIERALSEKKDERMTWTGEANAETVEARYQDIIKALEADHEATVLIDYTEAETGMDFIGEGTVQMNWDDQEGRVITLQSYEARGDCSLENLVDYGFCEDIYDAMEYKGYSDEDIERAKAERE